MKTEELNKLIIKLLAIPEIKAEVEDTEKRAKQENWGKADGETWIPWCRAQSELQALHNFIFQSNLAEVIAIPEIFLVVQLKIRDTSVDLTYLQERFLKECYKINGEKLTQEALTDLYNDIEATFHKKAVS